MKLINETKNPAFFDAAQAFIELWNKSDQIYTNTSGSTGEPSVISHQKKAMIASAKRTNSFFGIDSSSRLFLCLSPETIAGKMMIVRSIVADCELIVSDTESSPNLNASQSPDFIAMVPMQLEYAIQNSLSNLKQIKNILIGGAPLSSKLIGIIREEKLPVFHSYGMTETISHVALCNILDSDSFIALDGVSFEVSDENTLIINDSKLAIKQLKTNDIVQLESERIFKWLGRLNFTINSGGIKIQPEEIEKKLSSILHEQCISFGLPDEILGTKHCLIIESSKLNFELNNLYSVLSKYEIPKEIFLIDSFAYTQSGKIDRNSTIELIKNGQGKIL